MGFGIDKDVNDKETPQGKFIPVNKETAIDTGRYITKLEVGSLDNGTDYFEVEVTDKEGRIANRRYFEPKIDGEYVKDEKKLKTEQNKVVRVVANIARKFLGDDYTIQEAPTFKEFVTKVFNDIGDKYKDVELRAKLVVKNDFPTLPGYAPIFELASVPEAESKLKITDFDKVEREEPSPDSAEGVTGGENPWNK